MTWRRVGGRGRWLCGLRCDSAGAVRGLAGEQRRGPLQRLATRPRVAGSAMTAWRLSRTNALLSADEWRRQAVLAASHSATNISGFHRSLRSLAVCSAFRDTTASEWHRRLLAELEPCRGAAATALVTSLGHWPIGGVTSLEARGSILPSRAVRVVLALQCRGATCTQCGSSCSPLASR